MCVQKCEGLGEGESVVSVYFPNSKRDPQQLDCSVVFPLRRAVLSGSTAEASVEALLRGPTEEEKTSGAFTSVPEDATLKSLVVKNGVATADFSSALNRVAGSCRVASIRAQIEKTLLAVDGVQAVAITVNGKSEEVLQP
jgi:spore germination protein GerM